MADHQKDAQVGSTEESAYALTSKYRIPQDEAETILPCLARVANGCCTFPGFLNAEIAAPTKTKDGTWMLVQRFRTHEQTDSWKDSEARKLLLREFETCLPGAWMDNSELISEHSADSGVALCISTEMRAGTETEFMDWTKKIYAKQAGFCGYDGSYIQGPTKSTPNLWTTVLRFDSPESLDSWFSSRERATLLEQGKTFIASENVRKMVSSFPGWLPTDESGESPASWKGSILVLMVLFPTVFLQSKFIRPMIANLNTALVLLLLNAMSIAIVSFLIMPIVTRVFKPWLFPPKEHRSAVVAKYSIAIAVIYALELAILWQVKL